MMMPLPGWAALFLVPALLMFLNGNAPTGALIVVVGVIFMFGFWLGRLQSENERSTNR